MSKSTVDFIRSICPELSQVESVHAAQRLDEFNGFFARVKAWRESLPPGYRKIPKPIKTEFQPYRIVEQMAEKQPANDETNSLDVQNNIR